MPTTTTATATKPRAPRKPKAKLPPALAHEMDILRAARMGVDISYMAPDQRCKYPSKFCCKLRARKSTGRLHRFCEEHRSRANVNQKRWTEIRRRHEVTRELVATSLAVCMTSSWIDEQDQPFRSLPAVVTPRRGASKQLPLSPTNVDALYDNEIPLSEDEIDVLTSIVARSEQSDEYMSTEDTLLMALIPEVDMPMVLLSVLDDFTNVVL